MSVDPMIQAKTGPGNRAWIRRCSESKPAGLSHFKANQTRACSRQAVGFHSTAPKFRQRNRDNRSQLPRQHYYATYSPLEVNDTRRPYSAPSITPQMLRYADTLRTADSPPNPPRMRLWVPSAGSKSDPAAGIPGPLGNMSIQDNAGPSTPENLSKLHGNFRCRMPFRSQLRPESAPPGSGPPRPGVPKSLVPPGYAGFQPGLTTTAGCSRAAVMQQSGMWKAPAQRGFRIKVPPRSVSAAATRASNVA